MKTPAALRLAYIGFALLGVGVVTAYLRAPASHPATSINPAPAPTPATGAIPTQRPEFTLTDLAGKRRPISEWDGHPQLVNFWATWCVPCRKEIPLLNRLQADYAARGLRVIGIAVDFPDDVQHFIATTPLSYDLLMGEEDATEAARAYGIHNMALPFSAFVDSHGRILTVRLGQLHEATTRATLDALLQYDANTLDAPAARRLIDAAAAAEKTADHPSP